MDYNEYSAKSIDEAITTASVNLGVPSSELYYEVVDKGSGGILGFGKKDVTIKACKLADKEKFDSAHKEEEIKMESNAKTDDFERPKADEEAVTKVARDFLSEVFSAMELDVEIDIKFVFEEGHNNLSIDLSGDHMALIIGKRGQTLDSLQYLVNLVVNKNSTVYVRVKIDTEDYRRRREETLINLAKNIASKVKKTGRPCKLEPMNPYERRTIHYALQGDKQITTSSEGDEPYRHVVVKINRQ